MGYHGIPADALPWAIGIAKWQLYNAQRAQRRTDRLTARVAATGDYRSHIADHAEQVIQAAGVRQALEQMTPADAGLVRLWAWDDLSLTQIGAVLGSPRTRCPCGSSGLAAGWRTS